MSRDPYEYESGSPTYYLVQIGYVDSGDLQYVGLYPSQREAVQAVEDEGDCKSNYFVTEVQLGNNYTGQNLRVWCGDASEPHVVPAVVDADGVTWTYKPETKWSQQLYANENGAFVKGPTGVDWSHMLSMYGPLREASQEESESGEVTYWELARHREHTKQREDIRDFIVKSYQTCQVPDKITLGLILALSHHQPIERDRYDLDDSSIPVGTTVLTCAACTPIKEVEKYPHPRKRDVGYWPCRTLKALANPFRESAHFKSEWRYSRNPSGDFPFVERVRINGLLEEDK